MSSPAPSPAIYSARSRWIAVFVLTVLYTLHSVDRYVIAAVIEPIRHEFNLTDTQLGALGGFAHAIAFAIVVLPIGYLIDRVNRVKLLSFMLALWSTLTALGALSTGYWHVFLVRMGVGAAESASSPTTQSLVASMFPPKERSSALGMVFSGLAIGTGLAFAVGGWASEHWGWRSVFLLAGIPGLLLALVMWLVMKEPPRNFGGHASTAPAPPIWNVIGYVFRTRAVGFTIIGLTLATMSSASVWVWTTPILIRQQGFSLTEAGLIVGAAGGIVKFISTLGSGFLADWLAKGRIQRLWIVPSTALALSAPVAVALTVAPSQWLVILLVLILGLTMGTHYSAPKSVIVSVSPDNMRGTVTAIEELAINLIGGGLGPLMTGAISDHLGGDPGMALAATLSLNLVAALCFWLATSGMKSAATKAAAAAPPPLEEA